MSTTSTNDLAATGLTYADLAITIKDPNSRAARPPRSTSPCSSPPPRNTRWAWTTAAPSAWPVTAGDAAQKVLVAARSDKKSRAFRVTFADGSKFEFLGLVTQYQWQGQLDNVVSATFNVRVTGAVKMTDAPANGG